MQHKDGRCAGVLLILLLGVTTRPVLIRGSHVDLLHKRRKRGRYSCFSTLKHLRSLRNMHSLLVWLFESFSGCETASVLRPSPLVLCADLRGGRGHSIGNS